MSNLCDSWVLALGRATLLTGSSISPGFYAVLLLAGGYKDRFIVFHRMHCGMIRVHHWNMKWYVVKSLCWLFYLFKQPFLIVKVIRFATFKGLTTWLSIWMLSRSVFFVGRSSLSFTILHSESDQLLRGGFLTLERTPNVGVVIRGKGGGYSCCLTSRVMKRTHHRWLLVKGGVLIASSLGWWICVIFALISGCLYIPSVSSGCCFTFLGKSSIGNHVVKMDLPTHSSMTSLRRRGHKDFISSL